jgi:hypothetical protein
VIVDGKGTTVKGAGTAGNPYIIDSESAIDTGSLIVLDTPSLDLHLVGEGTPTEPLALSGDVTIALTGLSDVDDTSVPANGEVPTWVTNHWEFLPPTTASPGLVAATNGLSGDGSAPTPLRVKTSGVWGSGTLANLGADSTVGMPTYIDSAGNLRAFHNNISDLNLKVPSARDPWIDEAGWSIVGYAARIGQTVQHWVEATHTGSSVISGGSDAGNGNIQNLKIGTLRDTYAFPFITVATSGTGGGMIASFCVMGQETTDPGGLYLTAMIPGTTIGLNYYFSFGFTWLTHIGTL